MLINGDAFRRYSAEASSTEHMSLIKQLQERTRAPIKDVKSTLVDCNWDMGKCSPKGTEEAWNRSYIEKVISEGLFALAKIGSKAAVIELNCETDFVVRNEIFQYLASSLVKLALLVENDEHLSGVFPVELDRLEVRGERFVLNFKRFDLFEIRVLDHNSITVGLKLFDYAVLARENVLLM